MGRSCFLIQVLAQHRRQRGPHFRAHRRRCPIPPDRGVLYVRTTRVRTLAMVVALVVATVAVVVWRSTLGATANPTPQADPIVDVSVATPVQISTDGPSELQIVKVTLPPGTSTGWHSHDAFVLVGVESGTAT